METKIRHQQAIAHRGITDIFSSAFVTHAVGLPPMTDAYTLFNANHANNDTTVKLVHVA